MLKNKTVEDIINRIETKIYNNEKVNINDVERISGYSRRYIQLIFKEKTGLNISSYIRKRRLSLSAILIRLTRKSISHIAMDLNFSSLQSFTRSFIREFKISPLQYRNDKYFDCSYLTPPFTFGKQKYLLKKEWINSKKIYVKEFTLTESLIGSRLNRAKKTRRTYINYITSQNKDVFVITNIAPFSTMEHNVSLKTLIGFEDDEYNYEIETQECWVIEFIGGWNDYVKFGRFLIFHLDITIGYTIIEKIILISADESSNTQNYRTEIYFPVR